MDAKEAIVRAKTYFADMFADEKLINIGLEEVRREEEARSWLITLGFSRVWDSTSAIVALTGRNPNLPRFYKTVRLKDSDGSLVSITNREVDET